LAGEIAMHAPVFVVALSLAAAAQGPKPAPRAPNGQPDLSGVWVGPWQRYDAANGDDTRSRMPFGLSRSINAPYPLP
jgi:hypothetical protein